MADRMVRAVWAKPRRRIGFSVALAGLFAAAVLLTVMLSTGSPSAQTVGPNGPDPKLQAIAGKVNALLGKMTVAEKFGQLEQAGPDGANGTPGPKLLAAAQAGQIGSVLDLVGVQNINQAQQAALKSRLHIPLIFSLDVIHGYKTMFPVPLGEAASWDPATVQKDEAVSAREATADGIKWTFNPMVDISRDPRWGRVVEGAGEDPFLGSAIAAAKVRGYQGNDYSKPNKMAATVKHFAGYGAPVAGREYNTVDMSLQQFDNDYAPPYKAAVDAGAATVMSAFNSFNGVPATANPQLLQQILRQEWGFGGTVISDYQAIQELEEFGYASDGADAARLALTAGVDIEMAVAVPDPQFSTYINNGPALLRQGKISMAQLNNAVRHVLTLKYLAGMFDHPYTNPNRVTHAELTPTNLAAARTSADRSMVLLKDDNKALPLSTGTKSIAVVGPLANNPSDQLGPDQPIGYDLALGKVVSVVDGIKAAAPNATVTTAPGCDPNCTSDAGFADAVNAAKNADVTVVVLGEPAVGFGRGVVAQRHRPPRRPAAAGAADRRHRQALRGRADERASADDPVAGRQRASAAGGVVPGHRGRRRGRRRPVRQGQPRRQAADVVPAQRRADPALLQRAAHRAAGRPE